jgi:hypothetical protein
MRISETMSNTEILKTTSKNPVRNGTESIEKQWKSAYNTESCGCFWQAFFFLNPVPPRFWSIPRKFNQRFSKPLVAGSSPAGGSYSSFGVFRSSFYLPTYQGMARGDAEQEPSAAGFHHQYSYAKPWLGRLYP